MASLRIGYDLFAGTSQAGTDGAVGGDVLVETNESKAYKMHIVRHSDDYYWNHTTQAYVASAPSAADTMTIPGSDGLVKGAVRRLRVKLPNLARSGATSAGLTVIVFPEAGTASIPTIVGSATANNGVSLTIEFAAV